MELIGDVNCPNKKCRSGKCVCLTSFEEINESTYECKQCEAYSHVLNFLFKDEEPCCYLIWLDILHSKRRQICLVYQKKKNFGLYCDSISTNQNSPRHKQSKLILNLFPKKQRFQLSWNNHVTRVLVVLQQHKYTFLQYFCVESSASLVKGDCFLHIVEHISTHCKNFPI